MGGALHDGSAARIWGAGDGMGRGEWGCRVWHLWTDIYCIGWHLRESIYGMAVTGWQLRNVSDGIAFGKFSPEDTSKTALARPFFTRPVLPGSATRGLPCATPVAPEHGCPAPGKPLPHRPPTRLGTRPAHRTWRTRVSAAARALPERRHLCRLGPQAPLCALPPPKSVGVEGGARLLPDGA